MIYGEISEDARFRFLSAGQPPPAVFSNQHDRFMEVGLISFPPVGLLPSLGMIDEAATDGRLGFKEHYTLNDWSLMGAGDILLLHTDGLAEHRYGEQDYFPYQVEQTVRRVKDRPARAIYEAVRKTSSRLASRPTTSASSSSSVRSAGECATAHIPVKRVNRHFGRPGYSPKVAKWRADGQCWSAD